MPDPYATDEPHAFLWLEQSINAAVYIGAIAYGIHVTVAFLVTRAVLQYPTRISAKYLIFVGLLFIFGTINIVCNIRFNELTWIDERNYPGGPLAYILEQQANPVDTVGNVSAILSIFLADGFLLYRCFVVWQMWYILAIPSLMYLSSTALSVLTVLQAAKPDSSLWAQNTLNFSLPYWSISMALNILLSILIISRLLWLRKKIRTSMGDIHGVVYTKIVAIFVESAIFYGLVSLVFVVLYGTNNTAENLFIPLLAQIECIIPNLILLRMIRGQAWSKATMLTLQTGYPPATFSTMHPALQTNDDVEKNKGDVEITAVRDSSTGLYSVPD